VRIALLDGRLTFAEPGAPGKATCPGCGGVVRLYWSRQGAHFWRHKHSPRGVCSLVRRRPGDEEVYAIVTDPATSEVRFGRVRDDDLEKMRVVVQEDKVDAVELPADEPFVLVLAGPGVVVMAGKVDAEEGDPCK